MQFSDKDEIDILLLSEMVFTGYKFEDKEDIRPYLEVAGEGPTFQWCAKQAQKYSYFISLYRRLQIEMLCVLWISRVKWG